MSVKAALLFAGQGAQYPGMGAGLAEASAAAAAVFAAAGPDSREHCLSASAEELARTEVTQPAVLAVDLACARTLEEAGLRPAAVAGFSLGEIGALAFAGVFSDQVAFELIGERARLMEEAARSGTGGLRAVLGATERELRALLEESGLERLELANFNAPTQIVISGPADDLATFGDYLAGKGLRSVPLRVSGAFHSSFMQAAADGFARVLARQAFAPARIPVIANVTGEPYPAAADQAKALLARQIASPVRWTRSLQNLQATGITRFIEVGPGSVLTGLVRKTLPGAWCRSVQTAEDARGVAEELREEQLV